METNIINIFPFSSLEKAPQMVLGFKPFVDFLKNAKQVSGKQQCNFFDYVINQFEQYPELLTGIAPEDAGKYEDVLHLIYHTLNPIIENEEEHSWALCMPGVPVIFYSTKAFYNLLTERHGGGLLRPFLRNTRDINQLNVALRYSMILEKAYNTPCSYSREMIKPVADEVAGFTRYFKIMPDVRFINVSPVDELPPMDPLLLQNAKKDMPGFFTRLQTELPVEKFRFEGFGITSAVEVTAAHALESIKEMLLSHVSIHDEEYYSRFEGSLKSLIGTKDIQFGIMPFLQVNNKVVFKEDMLSSSILMRTAIENDMMDVTDTALADDYMKNPETIFFPDIYAESENTHPALPVLELAGLQSYAMLPVFFNNVLVGVLEVYSKAEGVLTEVLLARLEPAMPLLAQLLKNTIDILHSSIDQVMKEKFTAIQPSVQWKFNEVAWRYLLQKQNTGNGEIEDIIFRDVFPLYGAVDIRNSTIDRNAALAKDLEVQFDILLKVLEKLKKKSGFGLLDEKIFLTRQWMNRALSGTGLSNETRLNDFLENDINPFLIEFTESEPELFSIAEEYFVSIDDTNGIAYENRREQEASMTTVISAVNKYFDLLKEEMQQHYPCYFEKFRTDGVEYDIYIGQSISPNKTYSDIYLKNLRLMQITSMAAIARYTHSLAPQLSKPVETTQLIFIHSHPIEIRFRKDEKRFDVEGAYNIRYHIVKKRIDKVRVKETKERLTQPYKIAFVYFNQKEADEYISYIRYLQSDQILANDLELLELEELQGVSGLKALRVGVNLEFKTND
ncbi:MAG: GAF domain-containing protein [Agriterribacter sp.]